VEQVELSLQVLVQVLVVVVVVFVVLVVVVLYVIILVVLSHLKEFKKSGYRVKCFVVNAKYLGVPQNRERVFFIVQVNVEIMLN
jgi:phage shock protein PspC (stress-responsive transcriptional regulator)